MRLGLGGRASGGDSAETRPTRVLSVRSSTAKTDAATFSKTDASLGFSDIYTIKRLFGVCASQRLGSFSVLKREKKKKTPFSDSGAPRSRGCASIQAKSSAAVRSPAPLKEPFTALASPRQEHALPVSWPREKAVFSASNVERATLFFQRRAGEAPVKRDLSNGTSITCCAGGLFVFAA